MQKNKKTKNNLDSITKSGFADTDPQKVKQEIRKDVSEGQGDITSREAGGLRD